MAYLWLQQNYSLALEPELAFYFLNQSVSNFDLEIQLILGIMLSHWFF